MPGSCRRKPLACLTSLFRHLNQSFRESGWLWVVMGIKKFHVMALAGDATVTISHRYTPKEQLKQHTIRADIVVAAAGKTRQGTRRVRGVSDGNPCLQQTILLVLNVLGPPCQKQLWQCRRVRCSHGCLQLP